MDDFQPFEQSPEDAAREQAERFRQRLEGIVQRIEKEAENRVGKRVHVERRWIEDLEQYHGIYDEKTRGKLTKNGGSQVFINLTRPKTNAMSARLIDLLFPTDDRNWSLQPSPVPELVAEAEEAAAAIEALQEQLEGMAEAGGEGDPEFDQMRRQAEATQIKADELKRVMEEAQRRASLMQEEIFDQLKACGYQQAARDVIEDACKIGTGVIKGPVTGDKLRRGWGEATVYDQMGQPQSSYAIEYSEDMTPSMRRVDPWAFFPDPDARSVDESEGFYIRHLMKPKDIRRLGKTPGFDPEALRRLLKMKPALAAPSYLIDLRNITDENTQITNDMYHVWEYLGPLSVEDMRDLAAAVGDDDTIAEIEDIDPLEELQACVWVCQGELLKFSIYPLDSGEPLFSVFNLEKHEASIFGYGVPWMMRDDQRALNAAWRMMMDNAALGTGPQVIINKSVVEPENGSWEMTARKVWAMKEGVPINTRVFDTFAIDMHQNELANIVAMARNHIDEVTSMPTLAHGDQGTGTTKTAQGMALLMNSANVVFRRIVKNFDDDFTTPNIRRLYDWNMQMSDKDYIKGDYEVDARGSSVLLLREMQAQNLMMIALQFGAHPVYGPMLKHGALLRDIFQAHMIPGDKHVFSDREIEATQKMLAQQQAEQAEAEAQGQGQDEAGIKELEIQAKVEIANLEAQTRLQVAEMQREVALTSLAEKLNMTAEELRMKMEEGDKSRRSKERIFAGEAALSERIGRGGGGYL
jgi:hypothetical protein